MPVFQLKRRDSSKEAHLVLLNFEVHLYIRSHRYRFSLENGWFKAVSLHCINSFFV